MLNSNALTTVEHVLLHLKQYMQTKVTGKALIDSGGHLNFAFPNGCLIRGTVTISEASADVTTSASIDYEHGTAAFAEPHINLTADYTYLAFNYSDEYAIEQKINSASAIIEQYCERKFGLQTYVDEPHTGDGRQMLVLNQYPVRELISAKSEGLNNVPDYQMSEQDAECGEIYAPNGWSYDGALVGLVGEPIAPYRPYLITYTAGYVLPKDAQTGNLQTLPDDLEEACIELVSAKMNTAGNENIKSDRLGDAQQSYFEMAIPPAIQSTLDSYKRFI